MNKSRLQIPIENQNNFFYDGLKIDQDWPYSYAKKFSRDKNQEYKFCIFFYSDSNQGQIYLADPTIEPIYQNLPIQPSQVDPE